MKLVSQVLSVSRRYLLLWILARTFPFYGWGETWKNLNCSKSGQWSMDEIGKETNTEMGSWTVVGIERVAVCGCYNGKIFLR